MFHQQMAFFILPAHLSAIQNYQTDPEVSRCSGTAHTSGPCPAGRPAPHRAAKEQPNRPAAAGTRQRTAAQTKPYSLWRPTAAGSWRNTGQEKPFLRLGGGEKKFPFPNKSHRIKIRSKIPSGFSSKITDQSRECTCRQLLRLECHTEFDLQLPLCLRSFQDCSELAAAAAAISIKMFQL